ncbi:MAG: GIY-YIG nuclease family protein [Epsilonproteobacteria bacterium]|nr:GIY-YIG nuclease family protein [Campylobacterota bacterium]
MAFYVYIMANKPRGTLYIGVTNNLSRRVWQHKQKTLDGFSKKYNLTRLVWAEKIEYGQQAIAREKQLKRWHREWKVNLIESLNPEWDDLYSTLV